MRIAFFVNDIEREYPRYTTTVLALSALNQGHQVHYITPDDFVCRPDDSLALHTIKAPKKKYTDVFAFHEDMKEGKFKSSEVDLNTLDVMMLRNDPSLDAEDRPWAAHAGIVFGQLAAQRGVLVVNDPEGLGQAWNKLYFQTYPQEIRPKTLISKNAEDIKDFVQNHKGKVILKPLQGSGGKNVFVIGSSGEDNLNQIIETISNEGYVIAQGFLAAASEGDVRLFMMNGRPLEVDGVYAAIQRVPNDDIRSNMHAGGEAVKVDLNEEHLRAAELVRPKLMRDGMFLVGLDIVGSKILEVNVFSPGALHSCCDLHGVDFGAAIIKALENKVAIKKAHLQSFSNRELATL